MAKIEVKCPYCGETKVSKNGKSAANKQRYICKNSSCKATTFMLEYTYIGSQPHIEEKIIKMASNTSGIRDTARVLDISTDKVISTLKKQKKQ